MISEDARWLLLVINQSSVFRYSFTGVYVAVDTQLNVFYEIAGAARLQLAVFNPFR